MSFEGATELSLDAKFRLTVPARHRDALSAGGGIVVTLHPQGCLLLYPKLIWEPMKTELMALGGMDPSARDWQLLMVGHADTQEVDGAGRILVNPVLRRRAGLESKVVFIGQGHRCEIWEPGRWEDKVSAAAETAAKGPPPGASNFRL